MNSTTPLRTLALTFVGLALVLVGTLELPAANVALTNSDAFGSTSWNAKGNWNASAAPSSGNDYFTANFMLRTPNDAVNPAAFAGTSLSIDPGGSINTKHGGFWTNSLLKFNGGSINLGGGASERPTTNFGAIQLNATTNSTLATDTRGRAAELRSVISGSGSANFVISNIWAGVTLSGANTFNNGVAITNALVRLNHATALGTTTGGTFIGAGGMLELNGISPGAEPVTVSGGGTNGSIGAIVNAGTALVNNGLKGPVTLTGDTVFGGANRWDVFGPLTFTGNGFKLTKVGANEIALAHLGSSGLGDIQVNAGTLTILGNTTMGDPAKTATVTAGTLNFYAVNNTLAAPLVKTVIIQSGANFYNNSGTLFFNGAFTLNGNANIGGNGTEMTLLGPLGGTGNLFKGGTHKLVLLGTNTYSGNTTINFNSGTLALGPNGSIANSPIITVNPASTLDVAAVSGGWILLPGRILVDNGTVLGSVRVEGTALAYGDGMISGNVAVALGGTLTPGPLGAPGALSMLQNLTCEDGSLLGFDLANVTTLDGGINDYIAVGGDLTLNGTVAVNFAMLNGAPALGVPYTVIKYSGTLTGSAANLVGNSPYPATFDTSVPGEVQVTFAAGTPGTLTWTGDGSANRWDAGISTNWFDGVAKALFFQGNDALFDDIGTSNLTVNLSGGLVPNSVTVNSSGNYTFAGAGVLGGSGGLVKQGSGLLTVNNANTFTGATLIEGGTLKLGNTLAVGSAAGATYVTNGGTLDVNALRVGNIASETVVVSGAGVGGNGAIVNNGTVGQNSALRIVTLAGDTTVGGAQRFDVRNDGGNASVSTGGQPFKYTKRGPNEHVWVGVEVDPALGDIEILEGRFGPETTTSGSLGDPTRTIYVGTNATFRFWGWNNSLTKNMILTNGAILWVNNGTGRILSPVVLDSGTTIADPDGNTLALSNVVSGAGGFNKIDTGTLILAGTNTFTGGVSNGAGTVIGTTASLPGALTNYATLTVEQSFDGAIAGPLVGPGTLNKAGLGTVALNNAAGYLGTANINAGMLTLAADNVFAATNINFNGGGISSADASARTITNFFTSSANYPTPTVLGLPGSGDLTFTAPTGNNGSQNKYWVISNSLVTVNSVLGGNGTITKAGPGKLQLNAINALSALTNAEGTVALGAGGMLSNANITLLPGTVLDASAQGSFKLFTGKTLIAGRLTAPANDIVGGLTSTGIVTVANAGVAGTLTISGGLTLAGGTLNFDLANVITAGGGVNDLIVIGGPLDLSGTTTIQINPLNGPLATGTYTLVSGTAGLASGGLANLTVAGTNGTRQTFTLDVATVPGSIRLIVGSSAPSLVWSGATVANWDINSSAAWMNGALPDKFWNYDAVLFDGTTVNPLVNLTATVLPSTFTVNAPAAFNHVISGSGKVSGSVGLTKNGLGIVTLSTANDFVGPVTVNAGTVRVGNASGLGAGSTIIVNDGGQVDMFGVQQAARVYSYTIKGVGPDGLGALRNSGAEAQNVGLRNLTLAGDATINLANRIDFNSSAAGRLGLTDGAGFRLTKEGPANAPFHGNTINLVELIINNGMIYGETTDFSLGTNVTVNPPGRVGAYGSRSNSCTVTLNGATLEAAGSAMATWTGPIRINGPSIFNCTGSYGNADIRISGNLVGTFPVTISGGNSRFVELTANNDSTYSGNLTVVSGNGLRLLGLGTWGTGTVTNNGTVEFNQTFDNALAYAVLGGGTITKNLTNILQLAGAGGDQFGDLATLNVAAGMVDLNGRMEAIRALTGSAVVSNSAATAATLILTNPSGTPSFGGTIAGNTTVIIKDSSSKNSNVQIFTGSNLFTGKLVIDNGHLRAANDWFYGAVPGAFDADNITLKNGGVLQNNDSFLSLHPNRGIRLDGGDGQFYAGWTKDITVNGIISGPGRLFKTDGGRLILNAANSYTGNTFINQARLVLTAGGTIDASPLITIASGAVFDVTAKGVYQIPAGQTIDGAGSVAGSLALPVGATLAPGTSLGTLTIGNDFLLNGGRAVFELGSTTTEGGAANDLLNVAGDLIIAGPTALRVEPWAGVLATTPGSFYTLINYSGSLIGNIGDLTVTSGSRYALALDFSVPGKVRVSVTSGAPADALWLGDWNNGNPQADWDVQTTPDWNTGVGFPDVFSAGDRVTFDDTAASYIVNLVGSLYAGSVTLVNDANDYTFIGSGKLSGDGLTKALSAKLTLANTGINDYTGATDIRAGTLQVGDGGTAGNLPSTSLVTNNSALIFNRSDAFTVPNIIAGTGLLQKDGTGTLTLSGASAFTGPVAVNAGALKSGHVWAFGTNGNSITANNGGQVDLNGVALAGRLYSYTLSGAGPDGRGALLNSGATVVGNSGISNVTLAADATMGAFGTGNDGGRYDIGTGNTTLGQYGLFDGGNFMLTKVGPGVATLRVPAVNFPSLIVSNGTFKGENFDFHLATNIVVHSNASIAVYGSRTNSSAVTLMAGATNYNDGGNGYAAWLGPITNLGPVTFSVLGINGNGNIGVFGNLYGADWYNILGANSRFVELWANNDATFSGNWNIPSGNTLRLSGSGTPGTGTITNSGTIEVFNTNATTLAANMVGSAGVLNQQLGAAPLTITGLIQGAIIRPQSGSFANPVIFASGADVQLNNILNVGEANPAGAVRIEPGASLKLANFMLGQQNTRTGACVQVGGEVIITNQFRLGHWPNNVSPYLMGGGTFTMVGLPAGQVNPSSGEQNGVLYLGIDGIGVFTQTGGLVTTPSLVLDNRGSTPALGGVVSTYTMEGGTLVLGPYGIKSGSTDANTTYQIYLGGGTVSASANWVSTRAMNLTGTNGNVTFDPAGYTIGLAGALSGNGGLVKNGSGTVILAGANTYFGTTLVNAGTLLYNGTLAAGAGQVTVAGGTLGGTGTVNASVVVDPAGTLSPATSIGTLTVNAPLTLAGNTVMEINKTGGARTSDRVVGVSTLTAGGTLTVVATGDTLVAGDSFDLFDAATFTDGFASFVLPALDFGLAWDTARLLIDGTIVVTGLPVLVTPPADQTAECGSDVTFTVAATSDGTLSYQWYLGPDPVLGATAATLNLNNVTDANEGQYSVAVQNAAGGFTAGPATLTVNDTVAPAITCPADVTVQCRDEVPAASIAAVTVTDACDPAPVIAHLGDSASGYGPTIITRTYRATDAAGNTATCEQTITVLLTRPDPVSYEPYANYTAGTLIGQSYTGTGYAPGGSWTLLSGDVSVAATGGSTFTSGALALKSTGGKASTPVAGANGAIADLDTSVGGPFGSRGLVDTGLIGGPTVTGTLYYSFLAKNNSADVPNGDEDFAAVELYNDAAEVFGVGNNWAAWAYSTFGPVGGDGDLVRPSDSAFKIMDGDVHLFVVKLEFTPDADDTVTVWMDPDLAVSEAGQPNTVYRRTVTGNAAFNKIAVRSGSSNNDNSWDFDEIRFGGAWDDVTPTAPAITAQPASVIAECPATNGVFTVTAAGTAPLGYQWYLGANLIPEGTNAAFNATAEGNYSVRVCNAYGSVTSAVVTLTVLDTVAPSITCPPDVAVQCDANVPPPDFAGGSASDACDPAPVVTHEGDVAVGTCPKVITRTYKVTDAAGLSATCTQTITVHDTVAPTINCGQNETVQCDVPWGFTVPIVADNCDPAPVLSIVSTETNAGCGPTFTATQVWLVADACGNSTTCTQIVTVVDTVPPTFTQCPGPLAVPCDADVPAPDLGSVSATDTCGAVTVTFEGDVAAGTCPKTITRTYKATDTCGNFSLCVQTITVHDTVVPTIACGASQTVECGTAWDFGVPTVSDNCDANPVVTVVSTMTNTACGNTYAATRTWQVTDACGNSATCTQTFTVVDTTAPVMTCPADVMVQCDAEVPAPDFAGGTASDTCNASPTVTHVGDTVTGSKPKVITRTYSAADGCGNETTCTQTLTVSDTEPPTLTCPADVTIGPDPGECSASGVNLGTPVVNDNCAGATVTNDAPGVFLLGTTVVTWTVTDAGGNTATCMQQVTVADMGVPSITQQPGSRTNNVGTTATFSVVAASCHSISYQWFFGTTLLVGETAPSLSVDNVQLSDAGDYSVVLSNMNGTVTSEVAVLTVNRVPLASDNGAATREDQPASLALAKLLYNDSDPDGDPLIVESVSATSMEGGTVTMDASEVIYLPPPGFTGVDRFTYTISDGRGGTATAQVEVFVAAGNLPSLNAVSISVTPSGYLIRFAGIPGRDYDLQRSANLSDWTTIVTLTAPLHGIMEYEDTNPPPGMAFYRTVAP